MDNKPITVITVLCDPKRVQTIALTCKCTRRWTERIPAEVHESALIARFECPACGQAYILQNKQFTREEEFRNGGQKQTSPVGQFRFDA